MGRRQQQPGKKICFTRKRNHRRHSAPAAMQLNVPLNEILYGKSYQSKKMRKAKEMEQMAEKLQGHVKVGAVASTERGANTLIVL